MPDLIGDWAENQPKDREIAAYCSCPNDATSIKVARKLKTFGFNASVLECGFHAWRDQYPVGDKPATLLSVA